MVSRGAPKKYGPIAEINVSGSAGTIHRLRALRPSIAICMARFVSNAGISLCLGDDGFRPHAVDIRAQDLAEQLAADGNYVIAKIELRD